MTKPFLYYSPEGNVTFLLVILRTLELSHAYATIYLAVHQIARPRGLKPADTAKHLE